MLPLIKPYSIKFMLCLATATHNLKWVKITYICFIWD